MVIQRLIFVSALLCLVVVAAPAAAQEDFVCDPDAVAEWIAAQHELSTRFAAIEADLFQNPRDLRRIPRFDRFVSLVNLRDELTQLEYPGCAGDLRDTLLAYWVQRSDQIARHMETGEGANPVEATQDYYVEYVLPGIYDLERFSGVDYFATLGTDRPEGAPPVISTEFEVGEIILSGSSIENVIGIDTITLPNCMGSSELSITRTFSKAHQRRTIVLGESETRLRGGARLPAFLTGELEVAISEVIGSETRETLTESLELAMQAAPGTTVTYEIEWVEVATTGVVEIIREDGLEFWEFYISDSIQANLRQPFQTECESGEPVEPDAAATEEA